ncbi:hypothetical protein HDV00_010304 [Rhizophlyctis rosea]|nr:hypothetical protein HDV00_010304 [Rhizophlyctis rosea]
MEEIKEPPNTADVTPASAESSEAAAFGGPAGDGSQIEFVEETGKYVSKGADGISYEWDPEKNAWFPMYDENLIGLQQSVYSVEGVDETAPVPAFERKGKRKKEKVYTYDEPKPKKPKTEPKPRPITSVYVTGLPLDTTEEEVHDVFKTYGVLNVDLTTNKPRIKLYKNADGQLKGDALVTYYKEESVELACNAEFKEKPKPPPGEGDSNSNNSAKPKLDKKTLQKKKQQIEKQFEWYEEGAPRKSTQFSKIVVLKRMFTFQELEEDPTLLIDLKAEVRDECEKLGEVTNVNLYDLEEDGIMTVRFKEPESAVLCMKKMNGRFFAGRRVEATLHNGKDKFRESKPSEDDEKNRESFGDWLEKEKH